MSPAAPPSQVQEFNRAIHAYESLSRYRLFERGISVGNVGMQGGALVLALRSDASGLTWIASAIVAYLLADFVNGLVHLYMDANTEYGGWAGPLIANFHLHHLTPKYRKRPLPVLYFAESGTKIWLFAWQALALAAWSRGWIAPELLPLVALFAIFSSVAEVSHYLCHTSRSTLYRRLARWGLLLSRSHHAHHHREDNRNYAFLNGVSDPLINWLARHYTAGYKQGTDLHFAEYAARQAER